MRLEITRRAELAVRALAVLGDTNEARARPRVKGHELATVLGTTTAFLPQVLGPLVRAEWVRSDPGPTGGYTLNVPLASITVLQVIEAIDGATDDGRCVVTDRGCQSRTPCLLHAAWREARTALAGRLDAMSVAELGSDGTAPA